MTTSPTLRPAVAKSLLWRTLYDQIFAQITAGDLADGTVLPTEMELCQKHAISRITVRRALGELEVRGLLRRLRGSGTVVVAPRSTVDSRLIHVVMTPMGHLLNDLHQALMIHLGALGCSHRTWGPEVADVAAIAAVPARGTIVVAWNCDVSAFTQQACLGRVVAIVPAAGPLAIGLPGIGIDVTEPYCHVLRQARAQGITSIIHLTYRHQSDNRSDLANLLMQACLEQSLSFSMCPRFDCGADVEFAEMRELLRITDKPVLLVCASDFIALCARKHVEAMQRQIPRDVSIIGMFDTPHSQAADLSTINVRPDDLVRGALNLIFNDRTSTAFTRIPGTVIIRGTGPLPIP